MCCLIVDVFVAACKGVGTPDGKTKFSISKFQRRRSPGPVIYCWGFSCCTTGAYDEERIKAECMQLFNFSGSGDWPVISLGGFDFSAASNIVFSNGEYDPWRIGVSALLSK